MSERKMQITVLVSNYPAPGQMKMVFVQQLVHAMLEQGVHVKVIATQSLTHAIFHQEKLLPRHSVASTEGGIQYEIFRPYVLSFGNHNLLEKFALKINKAIITSLLNKIKVNILYCHFWDRALLVYDYAFQKHKPLFVACGEGDDAIENMVATMPKCSLSRLAKAVTGVVSVSSENKRKCIDFSLSSQDNTEVFPNCVNIDIFRKMDTSDLKNKLGIKPEDFVISFVGSFIPRKGPDKIAEAVRRLNDSKIKVMFIGKPFPGYNFDFDCPGIIHKGPLDHNLLPQYISCSDVFVMPTQKEGCCNAIVEALALGIPVISSDGPFNDDILNEKNSIRVNPDDIDAITNAIYRLKEDKILRKSLADYSMLRHEDYSIKTRARNIINFLSSQIKKNGL